MAESAAYSAGDLVGNYKILGMAGSGGMGVVYRALDTKLERTVALKFLPFNLASNSEDRERFLREARTASSLDHPNIGAIYGLEETGGGRTFIVMAFYAGESLAQKIYRGPLRITDAADIAIQIAEGLAAAHAGTVVHRDLKPSNIMLTQSGVVKIVDFGLARLSASTGSTESLSTAGTIGYMSPEQTIGKGVDQRTDIWALGIVMAEMLAGKNPFARETPAATIFAILNEPPLPMDETREGIPLDLLRVVYRSLAKEPETRYQSCREIVADLKDVRSHLAPDEPMVEGKSGAGAPGEISRPSSRGSSQKSSQESSQRSAHASAQPSSRSRSSARGFLRSASTRSSELRRHIEEASRPTWGAADNASSPTRWKGWLLAAVSAVIVLVVVGAGVSFLPSVRERLAPVLGQPEEHIAVLPFENEDNNPANDLVLAGLMDSLASRLTNLESGKRALWVLPTSEVRRRKISDPGSALTELGATVAVQGSLRREGQTIHMTVNLVNTKNLRQLGSVTLDSQAGDFSSLEDETVARLAKWLRVETTPEMLRTSGGPVNAAAYELYLKALGYTQRYDKAGNLDLAVAALNTAVKEDPHFALGFAQLGDAYRLKYQMEKDKKWIDAALANCQKAQQLDDRLPKVFVTLGKIHNITGEYELALQEDQRALELDPRNAEAIIGLAAAYDSAGRTADAEAAFKKAIALRPDAWDGYNSYAGFLTDHGRNGEAAAQYRRAIELTPDNAALYLNLGGVYSDMGEKRYAEAEQTLRKALTLEPSYAAYANLGYLYIQEQKFAESVEATKKALQMNDHDYLVWGNLANAYEGLKDKQGADGARDREIALLEDAVRQNPRDANAQANLGLLYAQKKLRDKSISRIQSALALSPDDASVLATVGEAYEDLGDRAQALPYIKKSLQKGYSLADLKKEPDLQGLLSDPLFRSNSK